MSALLEFEWENGGARGLELSKMVEDVLKIVLAD